MNLNLKQLLSNPLSKRGIFDKISGYEKEKWALEAAIKADQPVHILLESEPGLGKTRFLKAIDSKYSDTTCYVLGSGASKEGMVDQLFAKDYRFLLVDEIEHMKRSDQAVLLSLMQDHELVEVKKVNTRRRENYNITVIATCNNPKKLIPPLLNRFKIIHLEPYTKEQFMKICLEQLDNDLAEYIAEKVWATSKSMREAERIAAMCHSMEDVDRYMELEV